MKLYLATEKQKDFNTVQDLRLVPVPWLLILGFLASDKQADQTADLQKWPPTASRASPCLQGAHGMP